MHTVSLGVLCFGHSFFSWLACLSILLPWLSHTKFCEGLSHLSCASCPAAHLIPGRSPSLSLLPVLRQLPCGSPNSRQVSHSLSHLSRLSYPVAQLTPSRSLTHKPATRHSTPISHPIPLVSVCAVGVNKLLNLVNWRFWCFISYKFS